MNLHPYGRLSADRLATFESTLSFPLPVEYRDFLKWNNGGKCQAVTVPIPALNERLALDVFLGLDVEPGLNLDEWNQRLRPEIPSGGLIIGTDPSGGFILMGLDPSWAGVYYWDYGFWFEKSTPKNNIYLLAVSFATLLTVAK